MSGLEFYSMVKAGKTDAPCSGNIRDTVSAVKIAAALSLSEKRSFSSVEIARILDVTGAAVNKYLHKRYSAKTARMVAYIINKSLEGAVVQKAASGANKDAVLLEIERVALDRNLLEIS